VKRSLRKKGINKKKNINNTTKAGTGREKTTSLLLRKKKVKNPFWMGTPVNLDHKTA